MIVFFASFEFDRGWLFSMIAGDFKKNNGGPKVINSHLSKFTDSDWSALVYWLISI